MERISFNEAPQGMLQVMLNVEQYISESGMDNKLLELVRFRVAQINGCAYCLDMHYKEAIHAGETEKRLYSLPAWRETTYFTPQERAVLAFTETLTKMSTENDAGHIHDELSKYFSKQEIAYLTLTIAQINSWTRIVRSFGTTAGTYTVREKSNGVLK